jgi:outer membrane beta-barrel protein
MQTIKTQSRKSMNTASRWLIALGLGLATAGGYAAPQLAEAQEVQVTGPLAGAPAVRKMRIYRDGRFQIQPEFGATLVDEFTRTMFAGVQMGYHFTDWLGIHAFYDYGIGLDTDLTDQVKEIGQRTDYNALSLPDPKNFDAQIGHIKFLTGIQATFIPLRGKLSLFQAAFVDTDFYLFGGVAIANVEERKDIKDKVCAPQTFRDARAKSEGAFSNANDICIGTQGVKTPRMALAPTFGVGVSLYFTDYLAMTLEYRAFPFKWNTSGTDEGGLNEDRKEDSSGAFPDGKIDAADRTAQFNQMFKLGFAFYLPGHGGVTK